MSLSGSAGLTCQWSEVDVRLSALEVLIKPGADLATWERQHNEAVR